MWNKPDLLSNESYPKAVLGPKALHQAHFHAKTPTSYFLQKSLLESVVLSHESYPQGVLGPKAFNQTHFCTKTSTTYFERKAWS